MSGLRPRIFRFQVVMLGVIVLSIAAVGVGGLGATESAWVVVDADEELSDRVSLDEELGVYIVEKGSRVIALSNRGPWNHEPVAYCATSELFEAARSGSKFDVFGRYFYGPAPRGMSHYPLRESNGELLIEVDELVPGPSRPWSKKHVRKPAGAYCVAY